MILYFIIGALVFLGFIALMLAKSTEKLRKETHKAKDSYKDQFMRLREDEEKNNVRQW